MAVCRKIFCCLIFLFWILPFSHSEHYYKDMSIRCKACPAGKFLADDADDATQHDSARDCVECKTKTYSLGGERFCSQCKVGTYELVSDQGQITGCQQCPSGYFSGSVGSVVCSSCEAGKYQNRIGLPYCLPCVPGRFTDTVGLSEWYVWVACFSGLWNAPRWYVICVDVILCVFKNKVKRITIKNN